MKRNPALLATAAALALAAVSAQAGCVDPRLVAQKAASRMPPVLPAPNAIDASDHPDRDSVVGTWIASYTSGGAPGGEPLIQWHDDGTEWENIDFPVLGGNLCMGEWRQLDRRRVRRARTSAGSTPDRTISGYFTETETDTLSYNGDSYSGNDDMTIFDLDGNLQVELTGTSRATRFP